MKDKQNIERSLRLLFLSKSLYYSVLWLLFSFIITVVVIGINQIFIPKLSLIRAIGIISISISLLFFIAYPIRFILASVVVPWLGISTKARLVKKYDGGLLSQYSELAKGNTLDKWSARKLFKESSEVLKLELPTIKKEWNVKRWQPVLLVILIGVGLVPRSFWKENTKEIVQGSLRNELVNQFTFKDTVKVNYGETIDLNYLKSSSYNKLSVSGELVIKEDTSVTWFYKERNIGSTYVECDSVSTLLGWLTTVHPPSYLKMNVYTSKDTVVAYNGSRVDIQLFGLLLDQVKFSVSRGTFTGFQSIPIVNDTLISILANNVTFSIPVRIIEDKLPKIHVIQNTRDTLRIKVQDDFGLKSISFNSQTTQLSETEFSSTVIWSSSESITVRVKDSKGQVASRLIKRPKKTMNTILSEASSAVERLEPFTREELERKNKEQKKASSKRAPKEEIKNLEKKEDKKDSQEKIDLKERTPEELDRLLEKLDELWKAEQLIEVLEKVDTAADAALDSAMIDLVEELDQTNDKDLKEAAAQVKEIPSEGEKRKKQAKEAAKKLKEALAEAEAQVSEDNVERIKRLLKSSWAVSMFQEELNRSIEVRDIKFQRNLMRLEQQVLDSLKLLIVSDPALSMALGKASLDFSNQLLSLTAEFIDNGLESVSIGYVVNALNEVDKVLYFILESEKQSLAAAKKKCKKGQPGQQGKPSASGSGDQGKKGKKPGEGEGKNGRKPGKTGGKRPAKQGEPKDGEQGEGSSGKIKENLKRLDEALKTLKAGGSNPALEEKLERLKRELLFESQYKDFKMENFERRLWEATKSIFEKDEQGQERQSNESTSQKGNTGEEVKVIIEKTDGSALPLPVLKQTDGDR